MVLCWHEDRPMPDPVACPANDANNGRYPNGGSDWRDPNWRDPNWRDPFGASGRPPVARTPARGEAE